MSDLLKPQKVQFIEGPAQSGKTQFALKLAFEAIKTQRTAFYSDSLSMSDFQSVFDDVKYPTKTMDFVSETKRNILDDSPLMDSPDSTVFVFDLPDQFNNEAFCKFALSKIDAGATCIFVVNNSYKVVGCSIQLYQKAGLRYMLPMAQITTV